jgi:hypothetical protein
VKVSPGHVTGGIIHIIQVNTGESVLIQDHFGQFSHYAGAGGIVESHKHWDGPIKVRSESYLVIFNISWVE